MDGILRIGEQLTVMVYLKDENRKLDVAVRDCWAYGEPNFDDPDTPNLQLTRDDGCPMRKKLMHFWARTYDTFDTGATLITYTNMSAFKFPDRMQVFLTCNVQVGQASLFQSSNAKTRLLKIPVALEGYRMESVIYSSMS
ncbi:hypothetical protein E2C01_052944 [Portunus trituberculatus]|uniref:ZP domain-containing protein n=1 Tax=Portunus trituberculatus TaxID=210409 RepID=A0A5B7GFV6_PORTR|nr:hypothetical protein [Portunus trituberculatus]